MSYPKRFVTYALMDRSAGANPFWHAFLILSEQRTEKSPVKIVDTVGYYPLESTTTNPVVKVLKHVLGFKINLQDGHGLLKREEIRFLNHRGIHGITFETTQSKFEHLKEIYESQMMTEEKAVAELDFNLKTGNVSPNAHTRFVAENFLASIERRLPRLDPFHVTMDVMKGFGTQKSYTCKNWALDVLSEARIIDEHTRKKITGGTTQFAFPRFSGAHSDDIHFVSTGPTEKYVSSRTKKVYYSRSWENENSVYWTSTPHIYGQPHDRTAAKKQYRLIRDILKQIHDTEVQLHEKIEALKTKPKTEILRQQLENQVLRIEGLYGLFCFAYQNQDPLFLAEKLHQARKALNVATLTMNPERMNYSFMLRALQSISMKHMLFSLICLTVALTFLSGTVCAVAIGAIAANSARKCFGFFKEEQKLDTMKADYFAFQNEMNAKAEVEQMAHTAIAV